ncbi:MAG: LamG domain-containing protein [Acidobacteriia bacterium]|nr:LamG domain-containing protein [Terriglobia bacterium]
MNLASRLFLALSLAPLAVSQITKYQSDVMALNPLGSWPLNGNPADVSGHGNDGTVQNGAIFTGVMTSPVEPQFLVLNSAKKQFIQMPTAGSSIFNLGALHPLTALAWFKTTRQEDNFLPILAKIDTSTLTGWAIGLDNNDGHGNNSATGGQLAFVFVVSGNTTLLVEAPQVKNDGAWHMVAATYDGSGSASGVKLYIDGLLATNAVVLTDSVASGSILNSAPLTIGATTDGSFQFEGNISGAAVFGTALTLAQIQQLADDAASARAYLGQFAFGGGWYSAIYFTNASLTDVSFPVTFTADDGTALNVPSIGGRSKTITLAAGASTVIEAPNVGDLKQGYVTVTVPAGVTGYGVFRQSVAGIPDQEAVVPLSVASGNIPMVFDETKYIFGISIVNSGNQSTTVTITATDNTGTVIATSSPIVIPGFNKKVDALRNLPGLSGIVGKQGTVRFTANGAGVAVLGLRFNGAAFTSIPTQPQSQILKFIGTP